MLKSCLIKYFLSLLVILSITLSYNKFSFAESPSKIIVIDNEVPRLAIKVVSENIIVKKGGEQLKIEFNKNYENNYNLEDYIHTGPKLREIAFYRKDLDSPQVDISQTIYVTIPENFNLQLLLFETENGNISIENLSSQNLHTHTTSGHINITNVDISKNIFLRSNAGTSTLTLPDTVNNYAIDITSIDTSIDISGKVYNGGNFILNENGQKRIKFNGNSGSLNIKTNTSTNSVSQDTNYSEEFFNQTTNLNPSYNLLTLDGLNIAPKDAFPSFNTINYKPDLIRKSFVDSNNIIKDIDITAIAVNVEFLKSNDNTFEVNLAYPEELSYLYNDTSLQLYTKNDLLSIKTEYNMEKIQKIRENNLKSYGILSIKLPQKQYNHIKLDLNLTNTDTFFDFNTSILEIYKTSGDVCFDFPNNFNNMVIDNNSGNLNMYLSSLIGHFTISNNAGDLNLNLIDEPRDLDLTILNKELSVTEVPTYWKCNVFPGGPSADNIIKYKNGNPLNIMNITSKTGVITFNINNAPVEEI